MFIKLKTNRKHKFKLLKVKKKRSSLNKLCVATATSKIAEKDKALMNSPSRKFFLTSRLFALSILCTILFTSCQRPDATEALAEVEKLFEENNWEKAAYQLKSMLDLGEEHPRIYALYAYVQNRRGLNQEVEKFILKAYPTNSTPDPQIMAMIGRIYLERGDYPEAIKALDLAYRNDLNNPIPLRLLMLAEINNCRIRFCRNNGSCI